MARRSTRLAQSSRRASPCQPLWPACVAPRRRWNRPVARRRPGLPPRLSVLESANALMPACSTADAEQVGPGRRWGGRRAAGRRFGCGRERPRAGARRHGGGRAGGAQAGVGQVVGSSMEGRLSGEGFLGPRRAPRPSPAATGTDMVPSRRVAQHQRLHSAAALMRPSMQAPGGPRALPSRARESRGDTHAETARVETHARRSQLCARVLVSESRIPAAVSYTLDQMPTSMTASHGPQPRSLPSGWILGPPMPGPADPVPPSHHPTRAVPPVPPRSSWHEVPGPAGRASRQLRPSPACGRGLAVSSPQPPAKAMSQLVSEVRPALAARSCPCASP